MTRKISEAPLERAGISVKVDVVETGQRARRGRIACEIGGDLTFSTSHLESYCLAQWEPVIFDALVVAAAVEFCDRIQKRQTFHWGREIELRIPVHDPDRWNARSVAFPLKDSLEFLTGDRWTLTFVARRVTAFVPQQASLIYQIMKEQIVPENTAQKDQDVSARLLFERGDLRVRIRYSDDARIIPRC